MKFYEKKDKRKGIYFDGVTKGWNVSVYPVIEEKEVTGWYFTLTPNKGYKFFVNPKDFTSVIYRSQDKCKREAEKAARREYKNYAKLPCKAFISWINGKATVAFASTAAGAKKQIFNANKLDNYLNLRVKRCPWADTYIKQGCVPKDEWEKQGFGEEEHL